MAVGLSFSERHRLAPCQSCHRETLPPGQPAEVANQAYGESGQAGEDIGWHTFRHSYRSWLDETGAPMKVQQELMRHASIQTTMNVYGRVMTETKRQQTVRL
jgi:integrase